MDEKLLTSLIKDALTQSEVPLPATLAETGLSGHMSLTRIADAIGSGWTPRELQHLSECAECRHRCVLFFRQECPAVPLMALYARGELSPGEHAAVKVHVHDDDCLRCKNVLQAMDMGWEFPGMTARVDAFVVVWPFDLPGLEWKSVAATDTSIQIEEDECGILELKMHAPIDLSGWLVKIAVITAAGATHTLQGRLSGPYHASVSLPLGARVVFLPDGSEAFSLVIHLLSELKEDSACLDLARLRRYAFSPAGMTRFERVHFESCARCQTRLREIQEKGSPNLLQVVQFARVREHKVAGEEPAMTQWFSRLGSSTLRQAMMKMGMRLWEHCLAEPCCDLRFAAFGTQSAEPVFAFAQDSQSRIKLAQAENEALRVRLDLIDGELHLSVRLDDPGSPMRLVHVEIIRGQSIIDLDLPLQWVGGRWSAGDVLAPPRGWLESTDPILIAALPGRE